MDGMKTLAGLFTINQATFIFNITPARPNGSLGQPTEAPLPPLDPTALSAEWRARREAVDRPTLDQQKTAAFITDRLSGLPVNCPVKPLGVEGDRCWYLDAVGQMVAIPRQGHSKLAIYGLFSPQYDYLRNARPEWRKTVEMGSVENGTWREVAVDFRPDMVARDLMAACAAMGPFTPPIQGSAAPPAGSGPTTPALPTQTKPPRSSPQAQRIRRGGKK